MPLLHVSQGKKKRAEKRAAEGEAKGEKADGEVIRMMKLQTISFVWI